MPNWKSKLVVDCDFASENTKYKWNIVILDIFVKVIIYNDESSQHVRHWRQGVDYIVFCIFCGMYGGTKYSQLNKSYITWSVQEVPSNWKTKENCSLKGTQKSYLPFSLKLSLDSNGHLTIIRNEQGWAVPTLCLIV